MEESIRFTKVCWRGREEITAVLAVKTLPSEVFTPVHLGGGAVEVAEEDESAGVSKTSLSIFVSPRL